MKFNYKFLFLLIMFIVLTEIQFGQSIEKAKKSDMKGESNRMSGIKNENEWENLLSPEEYHILREKGTERPFKGKYWDFFEKGTYKCAACGQVLFTSGTKFDAGCGWPSFYDVVNNKNVVLKDDFSFGMQRIEVMCSNCGGHLGHVFADGPKPTGQRYCINSVSIKFEKAENNK